MSLVRLSPAREAVAKVLENTHETLKWSWQVTMAFALTQAVSAVSDAIARIPELSKTTYCVDEWMTIVCFLIGFLPAFVRLFYGDNRYLDLHYSELKRKWNSPPESSTQQINSIKFIAERHPPLRIFSDSMLLLSHGIAFILMAKLSVSFMMYLASHWCMLMLNISWLLVTYCMNKRTVDHNVSPVNNVMVGTQRNVSESPRRDAPVVFWIINNAIFGFMAGISLMIMFNADKGVLFYSMGTLTLIFYLINSVVDLWQWRFFYWPQLQEIYMASLQFDDEG
jgi:hypothetical protein